MQPMRHPRYAHPLTPKIHNDRHTQQQNTGDPHYRTFDGLVHHYQGMCAYELAKPCMGNYNYRYNGMPFSIQSDNNAWSTTSLSYLDSLYITLHKWNGNIEDIVILKPGATC